MIFKESHSAHKIASDSSQEAAAVGKKKPKIRGIQEHVRVLV